MQVRTRNKQLQHRGLLQAPAGKMVLRNNAVSSWEMEVNANATNTGWEKFEEGWGVSIIGDGINYVSGWATEIKDVTTEAGIRTLSVSGASDASPLANSLIIPNPSDPEAQVNQWTTTGKAETAIRRLVNQQIGPAAPTDYRIAGLTLAPDQARGPEVSISERWTNLLEVIQSQAQTAKLLFDIRQDGEGLVFSISEPRDLTRAVRLTRANGGVKSSELTRTAPTATEVIVGGTGSGATRKMWREPKGTPKPGPWSQRVTKFIDRPSTSKDTELKQAAEAELESGAAKSSVVLDIGDTASAKFGSDFWLGDLISIEVEKGVWVQDTVQIAEVSWDEKGTSVKLQVGPEPDEPSMGQASTKLVDIVKKLSAQVRQQNAR